MPLGHSNLLCRGYGFRTIETDDWLDGGEGDDTYVLDSASDDSVSDLKGTNLLRLQGGGTRDEITLTAVDHAGDVVLTLANGHTLTLVNGLYAEGTLIEFADGTNTSLSDWVATSLATPLHLVAASGGNVMRGILRRVPAPPARTFTKSGVAYVFRQMEGARLAA